MGGVDAELPLQFKLPNSVRGKKKWHNCASIIGTAYRSKPLRQQFARQRQAATIMAAATRRMRAKGRFWTAKSNDRALLGTFQTWLSAGKLQSAVYSAISAATATTLAKSNGSSLVRAFTTWQRQSRSRWIVPAACTSYFVRRRALAAWATCCYSKARPAMQKTAQRYIVLAKDYLAIIKQHQVPEPIMSGETGQSDFGVRYRARGNVDFIGIMCGTTRHNVVDIIIITRTHRNTRKGGAMAIPFVYQPQGPGGPMSDRPLPDTVPHMLPVPNVFRSP